MGNIECTLRGPIPAQLLDRELNTHLPRLGVSEDGRVLNLPAVFDPTRGRLLTGALPRAKRALRDAGFRLRVRDRRSLGPACPPLDLRDWTLRDYQEDVVRAALAAGRGLIDVGTSGGKSLLAAAIIARLGRPALYLVTTRTLLHQTVENLRRHLGVEPGIIGDGIHSPAAVTAALAQSLDRESIDLSPWRGGTLIFDEGHHAAARTYLALVRRVDPRFHFYLSAVPFRAGADQVVLDALAGRPLTHRKYSAAFLIERGYASPVEVQVECGPMRGEMHEKPFSALYREFIVHNEPRNRRILEIAAAAILSGRSVLLLVERIDHGRLLLAGLRDRLGGGPAGVARSASIPARAPAPARPGTARAVPSEVAFVNGRTPRLELQESTRDFALGRIRCLVATNGLFQEGVSIDGIHVLIHAGGLKSRAKVVQTVGRGMRRAPGKTHCLYVEFWDDDEAGVFRAHSRQRLRVLKEEGFFVPEIAAPDEGGGPETAAEEDAGAIPPMWVHVAGTRRFLEMDGEGRIHREAVCLKKQLVPASLCRQCRDTSVCSQGGRITWQDASDCTASPSASSRASSARTARDAGTTMEG